MEEVVKEGDYVFMNGGGTKRLVEVRKGQQIRLGRSGAAQSTTLIGLPYGSVVRLEHNKRRFLRSDAYPDLDLSEINKATEHIELNDNRNLADTNSSQQLSSAEIAAIRKEKGLDELLNNLVEKSSTFESKTSFSKEKYLRKKKKIYGTLFKIERPTIDNIAETHFPTINPSDELPEDSRHMRLRVDTVALMLHHANVMYNSRVLVYDRTNGALEAYILSRLGEEGRLYQILDQNCQPTMYLANKVMGLSNVRSCWKAIPRNPGFLEGIPEEKEEVTEEVEEEKHKKEGTGAVSMWMKGVEARQELQDSPADSLIIADDETTEKTLEDLFPFLAYGGHLVIYSPFLEDLTPLFLKIRNQCININISETWYRHQQVLAQRTHPTVNMSTAAGYILTAIKVPENPAPRRRFAPTDLKRPRDEEEYEKTEETATS